jgi:ribosomal subunit interface protein
MQIQVNADNTVESHAPLVAHIESVVNEVLARFSEEISRVEVHLSVVNDHRQKGGEHRCLMEARVEHHPPIAASDQTLSLHQAIHGAAEKLKRAIGSTLGRIDDSARNHAIAPDAEAEPAPESSEEAVKK